MNWHMVTNSEIIHLSLHQRFFEYAHAYRNAAFALCLTMTLDDESCTWPNATVVMLLAAHSTELFIKGAIFARVPAATIECHRIDDLILEYRKHFPEPSFEWDVPFKTEWPAIAEAEIKALKNTVPIPSILYRYPVAKGGKEWNGAFGFKPNSFLGVLEQLERDFDRIKAQIV